MDDETPGDPHARPARTRRSAPLGIGVGHDEQAGDQHGRQPAGNRDRDIREAVEGSLRSGPHRRTAQCHAGTDQHHQALSRLIALSPPAIGERGARLERLGVVCGYTLDIDWAALGYPMTVYIPMTAAPGADLRDIIATLQGLRELDDVQIVTGQWDLIARFHVPDHAHLQEVLLVQIWQTAGIQRLETFLGLGSYTGEGLLGPVPRRPPSPGGPSGVRGRAPSR